MNTEQRNKILNNKELEEQEFQSDQEQQDSSQQVSSQDEVKQRAVFQFIDEQKLITMKQKQKANNEQANDQDENGEINEDQRQAFLYLLSVRKQKKTLLQEKKRRKAQSKKIVTKIQVKNLQSLQKQGTKQTVKTQTQKHLKIKQRNISSKENEYSECILNNFNIVVKNAKYLVKNQPMYTHNNKKFNVKLYQSIKLQNEPLIYDLMKLTIGEIQDAIRKLSLQFNLGPKNKKDQNKNTQKDIDQIDCNKKYSIVKYCLWIYSLLVLHQAWSAYKHFQSLAQINFVLITQVGSVQSLSYEQKKSIFLLFILMINVFQQKHLKKYIGQVLNTMTDNVNEPAKVVSQND